MTSCGDASRKPGRVGSAGMRFARRGLVPLLLGVVLGAFGARASIVVQPAAYHFGERSASDVVASVFTVRNEGQLPVRILGVSSTCGCTTAKIDGDVVAPGARLEIRVQITLEGRKGEQRFSLHVRTDDPDSAVLTVPIRGMVLEDIRMEPPRLLFRRETEGAPLQAALNITSVDRLPFAITAVRVSDDRLRVAWEPAEAGSYRLTANLDEEQLGAGYEGLLTLETNHPRRPRIEIPVVAKGLSGILARPTVVELTASAPAPQRRVVLVFSPTHTAFTITALFAPPGVDATVRTSAPHFHQVVLQGLTPSSALERTPLRVETSSGQTVLIPFRLQAGPTVPPSAPFVQAPGAEEGEPLPDAAGRPSSAALATVAGAERKEPR